MTIENIAVTGANGFIGRAMVDSLTKEGVVINTVDHREALTKDAEAWHDFFKLNDITSIYHFAAYGNHSTQKDPIETFKSNVELTYNMLLGSVNTSVGCFVNVATSSMYGTTFKPMIETDHLRPKTLYAASKEAAYAFSRAFAASFQLPVVTIAPFSVYGPGEADHRFIPTVIRRALNNEPIMLSPGVHDWIYIDDFISGVNTVVARDKEKNGGLYNIGTGIQISNYQVVQTISNLLETSIKIENAGDIRPNDSSVWQADSTKLRSLGWSPKVGFEDGLMRTIEYEKQKLVKND